jgi:hypothetical protein
MEVTEDDRVPITSALDIRRLSLFLAVVDLSGFTRAAQAVHIS